VAGLTETAIKSSPAYRALHREKEHLLGLLKDQAPQVAVPEKVRELIGAVRSVNRSRQHQINVEGDDEPCFWQRGEWVRYVLELADETEQAIAAPTTPAGEPAPYEHRVNGWMQECFGPEISGDIEERNHRFLEEALELVQSTGCTADAAHRLVDYVFGRPVGEPFQEVGGVRVTLAALCLANGIDGEAAAEAELARITQPEMVERIREKQKRKPAFGPLPGVYPEREAGTEQPVSDPDGLPSDWRRVVEGAADMLGESAKQHRGRGDNATASMCDRFGAMLRDEILSAPAPDEREIAALRAVGAAACNFCDWNPSDETHPHSAIEFVTVESALRDAVRSLRAGKEGEPS
jgi:hypothetical protein